MTREMVKVEGADLPIFQNEQSWYGNNFRHSSEWIFQLSEHEQLEILQAVANAVAADTDLASMTAADFPLRSFGARLQCIGREIKHGRGFALIRGLNTMGMTLQEQAYAFRGIGAHFGEAVSQNAKGHVLGHVVNLGLDYSDPATRGNRNPAELSFRTDAADLVGLMCIRGARSGGRSRIASSTTVWNEVVRRRPDLAVELLKIYSFTRWGEVRPGQKPYFQMPLFRECGGRMIVVFSAKAIGEAQAFPGVAALDSAQREAIALVNELANKGGIPLDMKFRPGDMQFLLNHAILHARTPYKDWRDPARRRYLLRQWLACPDGPALPDYMTTEFQGRTDSGPQDGVRTHGVALKAYLYPD